MSDHHLRHLAAACAPRIAELIEQTVITTVRDHLAGTIEAVLREQFPGETLRLYVPKRSVTAKRDRNRQILARYNGRNAAALAKEFGVCHQWIAKIVKSGG